MKLSLSTVSSGFLSNSTMTLNFTAIQNEFQNKVLYRNNPVGEPNSMMVDLDMDSNRILNLPEPLSDNEAARLKDVQNALAGGAANLISNTPSGTISATNVQSAINEIVSDLASSTGSSLVGGEDKYTTTYLKTLSDIINGNEVSITRFIPPAHHSAIRNNTSSYDASACLLYTSDAADE